MRSSDKEEIVTRLARVGYDNAIGYLKGGFEAWKRAGKETDEVISITADDLATLMKAAPQTILDVRKKSEFDSEHIEGAENAPLDYINESMLKVKKAQLVYVHCASGYRSMIFVSILKARGYDNIIDINDSFKAIKESGKFKITHYVQPVTQL